MRRLIQSFFGVLILAFLLNPHFSTAQIVNDPMGPSGDCETCNTTEVHVTVNHAGGCYYLFEIENGSRCSATDAVWNFGDGTGASGAGGVFHEYNNPGTYNGYVTITLSDGISTCTITRYFSVNANGCVRENCGPCLINPGQLFVQSFPVAGCSRTMSVANLQTTPSCPNLSLSIDFGDGSTPFVTNNSNPFSHTYPGNGTYTVCVTETHFNGTNSCSTTYCQNVTITGCAGCDPCVYTPGELSITNLISPCSRRIDMLNVDDNNGCAQITYTYDFGVPGVAPVTTSSSSYVFTFNQDGVYNICVTETHTANGISCSTTHCKEVTVCGCNTCNYTPGDLVVTPVAVHPCMRNFEVQNVENPGNCASISYIFDFGDGTSTNTNQGLVSHAFGGSGTYNVCVTEIHTAGAATCSTTVCQSVTVNCCPTCPIMDAPQLFTGTPSYLSCTGYASIGNYVNCPDVSYQIGWGDGTISNYTGGGPITHNYANAGTYNVCATITVTDRNGTCQRTHCQSLTIRRGCGSGKTGDNITDEATSQSLVLIPNIVERGSKTQISWSENSQITELRITDMQGREVMRKNVNGMNQMDFEIPSTMQAGMYFVMTNDKNAGIAKMIVR